MAIRYRQQCEHRGISNSHSINRRWKAKESKERNCICSMPKHWWRNVTYVAHSVPPTLGLRTLSPARKSNVPRTSYYTGARVEGGLCQITSPLPCALGSRGSSCDRKSQDTSCTDSGGKFCATLSK